MKRPLRAAFEQEGALARETLRLWTQDAKPADQVPERLDNQQPAEIRREEVLWGGYLSTHYGHFLTETVSRLWPLLRDGGSHERPVVLVGPRQHPSFATDWMEAFGADLVDLPPNETVLFTRMAVPEPAWRLNAWAAPEIRQIHLRARQNLSIPSLPSPRVLWLSRRRLGVGRKAYDERLLEWLLRNHVHSVSPETFSLAEQVGIMENSDIAAGIVGSAFHTLLLAESPPRCVFLCPSRVASAYVAQAELTRSECAFFHVLEPVPLNLPQAPRFPAGYRVMIPEALEALGEHLPELLDSPTVRGILESRSQFSARVTEELVEEIVSVVRAPYSANHRIVLGERFEAAGQAECAVEQLLAAADFSDDRTVIGKATRLLETLGQEKLVRETREREVQG